jgi:hypothetical protein
VSRTEDRPDVLSRLTPWAVAALLTLFAGSAFFSLRLDSATFDETVHLPSGYTYLDRLDYRLNPEHPPLAKAWAALPLWAFSLAKPDYDSDAWRGTRPAPDGLEPLPNAQWIFGFETLNGPLGDPVRRDPHFLLTPARSMVVVFGVLLGLIVFRWSRDLWGSGAGLVSLVLYALSPTVLAHTRLVTTDVAAALAFAATLWVFRGFTARPSWFRAITLGLALGASLLTKFSALILVPILAILAVVWLAAEGRRLPKGDLRPARLLAMVLVAVLLAWACVWAGYGFRFAASPDRSHRLDWAGVTEHGDPVTVARDARLLPEAWLYGLAYVRHESQRRLTFLDGEQSYTGWWYYFPEAFALKTPPATLVLLAWVVLAGLARYRGGSFDAWFLSIPVIVYLGASMASNLNLGHRHLLPVYPLLFVAAGHAAVLAASGRARKFLLAALLAGAAVSWWIATPRYLSYFNVIGGGPSGGWHHLVDSNTDWGQDLRRLADWTAEQDGPAVHLAYFGTADPDAYDLRYRKVFLFHDFRPDAPPVYPGPGDLLAVSVTLLQGVYLNADRDFAEYAVRSGKLPGETIREWLDLRRDRIRDGKPVPPVGDWLVATGRLTDAERAEIERPLLSTLFRRIREKLEPIARAGDSIHVYRIPDDPSW